MNDQQFAEQLVATLLEKTKQGRIKWVEDEDEDLFTTLPNSFTVYLSEEQANTSKPWYFLSLLDSDEDRILRVSSRTTTTTGVVTVPDVLTLWNIIREQIPKRSDVQKKSVLESLSSL